MCKWEELCVSKETFEACERLAKAGLVGEKIKKCEVEKANISELKCDKIKVGEFPTTKPKMIYYVSDNEKYSTLTINNDVIKVICNSFNNKSNKSVFEEVMEVLVDELEEELWDIYNNAEDEEEICLECLIRFFLEKSYSEGYKEGIRYYKDLIDEANQSIRDEMLEEVSEAGFES